MTAVTICSDFAAQGNKVCHIFTLYPAGSDGKQFICNAGDVGLIPGEVNGSTL